MNNLFSSCKKLREIDVSDFDTSNVTNIENMFSGCISLISLDLSSFNTSNVEKAGGMFSSSEKLRIIYVSELWSMDKVSSAERMFQDCYSLIGGNGTTYNKNKTNKVYACIDTSAQKGYFTSKV